MTRQADFRRLMRTFICDYCGADIGERCLTKSGRLSHFSHADRYYKAAAHRKLFQA